MSDAITNAKTPRPRCDGCRFLSRSAGNEFSGECRRFPPVAFPSGAAHFPTVGNNQWCGEHQDRGAAPIPVQEKVQPETPRQANRARTNKV